MSHLEEPCLNCQYLRWVERMNRNCWLEKIIGALDCQQECSR